MIALVQNQAIHYTEHGKGLPLIIIHGFYLDSICMERAIEETSVTLDGFRRIYVDMPGMGQSERHYLKNNSDVMLDLMCEFIEQVVEDMPFIVLGFSYGGYIARGVAEKLADKVIGEVLICPVVEPDPKKRKSATITSHDIDQSFFETLAKEEQERLLKSMVVINERTYNRTRADFARAEALADDEFLEDLYNNHYASKYMEEQRMIHDHKALIFLGYQDATCGYQDMLDRLDLYPKATVNLLSNASHSFFLEQPIQFEYILNSWLGQYKQK